MPDYPSTRPMTSEDDLQKQIEALHQYFIANPGMHRQSAESDKEMPSDYQALSGGEFDSRSFGITWPLLLAGALQTQLISRFNAGELNPAQVQAEGYKYKEQYPYLHDTFIPDILRNIGYEQSFEGNTILPDPQPLPQGYLNEKEQIYRDVNRG